MPTFRENIKLGTKVSLMKTEDINDQAITKDKIRDGNVTTEKLADGVVKTNKISDASITTPKIADGNITTEKLKDSSVTTQKIANGNVTEDKIANQSVTNDKLAPSSVTNDKIKSSSVITEKINNRAVTTEKINDKAITNQKLDDKSVDARTICESNVQTRHLADEAVTTDKINDGAVTNEKIADGTMKIGKLDPELRATLNAAIGLPDNLTQVIQDVDENIKGLHEKDTNLQSQIDDNLSQITDNDKDISVLQERSTQMENSIKDISATGGASTANAVSFDNTSSGITSVNVQGAIDELNTTLQAELDTKVDKEEGKSLIDDEVKQHFELIENDEWLTAMVDAENHLLFGIHRDTGKPYFPLNDMYHVEQNEEFFALWLDEEDHILMGIRRDGQIVGEINAVNALKQTIAEIQSNIDTLQSDVTSATDKINTVEKKVSTIDTSLQELLNVFSIQENPEFLAVETDAEGKMLAYTKNDGSHYAYNMKSETIPEEFSHIEDPEGRMAIETDAEQKILAYRDKDGVKHEHEEEVNTLHVSNLDLKDNSVNDIRSALIANGFNVKTPIDWSDYISNDGKNPLYIPEPRCARINISGIDSMPTSKYVNNKAYFEMWDMQGNYFKKKVIINAQGNTTMLYPKKSFACDFFDEDWNGDAFAMKIGDWVVQDSFHFKAQYLDFFKGVSIVAYKLVQEVWASRSPIYSSPWKKALLGNETISSGTLDNQGINDLSLQKDTGAKCVPDAFPCVVYLNGEFYGLFNWALKKHRDNYHMDKSSALNIHIDGGNYPFMENLDWTKFEIRNPKGLLTNVSSGSGFEKYDGDSPKELLGNDTDGYDASNKTHVLSNNVKKAILTFNSLGRALNAMDKEEGDKFLAEHYDMDNLIDCYVMQYVFADEDEENNWQWVTYDGKKWYVCEYDKDRTFGQTYHCRGTRPANSLLNAINVNTDNYPFKFLYTHHKAEIKARYEELKSLGIFTAEHIISLLKDWVDRFSSTDFKFEYQKWAESPSNRNDLVDREHWKVKSYSYTTTNNYDNDKTYKVGETCFYGKLMHTEFECIKESTGNPPQTGYYNELPYDMGYHDSIWRVIKYIIERFEYIDENIKNLV